MLFYRNNKRYKAPKIARPREDAISNETNIIKKSIRISLQKWSLGYIQ